MKRRYGWRPDVPDHRDHVYAVRSPRACAYEPSVDMRPACPDVYDQAQLGSCTGQAWAAAYEFMLKKQGYSDFVPSRLGFYFDERAIEGTTQTDAGAMIRTGAKVAAKGVYPERMWPYLPAKFASKPPASAYKEALKHQALVYERVPRTLDGFEGALCDGLPIVAGISVYSSFESDVVARTGTAPLPRKADSLLGGHAILVVGYDTAKKRFICRNSWGCMWGAKGYFTLPFAYLLDANLSDDFWVIRKVEG